MGTLAATAGVGAGVEDGLEDWFDHSVDSMLDNAVPEGWCLDLALLWFIDEECGSARGRQVRIP